MLPNTTRYDDQDRLRAIYFEQSAAEDDEHLRAWRDFSHNIQHGNSNNINNLVEYGPTMPLPQQQDGVAIQSLSTPPTSSSLPSSMLTPVASDDAIAKVVAASKPKTVIRTLPSVDGKSAPQQVEEQLIIDINQLEAALAVFNDPPPQPLSPAPTIASSTTPTATMPVANEDKTGTRPSKKKIDIVRSPPTVATVSVTTDTPTSSSLTSSITPTTIASTTISTTNTHQPLILTTGGRFTLDDAINAHTNSVATSSSKKGSA
jgi:hypothetical protein